MDQSRGKAFGARLGGLLILLSLVIAGPFLLRDSERGMLETPKRKLVILTPHDQRVREEIGRGFQAYWKRKTGEVLEIDWRIPGGSSEIFLLLKSEFQQAFRQKFEATGQTWSQAIAQSFANPLPLKGESPAEKARQLFLQSSVGIGVDLLFGGGAADFQQLADAGYLIPGDTPSGVGIRAIRNEHPDWFREDVIPSSFAGERYRDANDAWVGVVLASFGILFNRDVLNEIGERKEPETWDDLTDPVFRGFLALADPAKSGSAAKAFELILQQKMQDAQAQGVRDPAREGWVLGLRLIQRLSGNARYFTDSSGKIGLEVARGEAAAGMVIDSYGRTIRDSVQDEKGYSRVGFVMPKGGTSLSVDPIAMLRGAEDPLLATAFMSYLLSAEGQALWALPPGVPGGPLHHALRRLPVRMDFYRDPRFMALPSHEPDPYGQIGPFVYHPEWTQNYFAALRFVIRVLCVDSHPELVLAWKALTENGLPSDALARFDDLGGVSYDEVEKEILPVLRERDKAKEIRLARILGEQSRERYRAVAEMAQKGENRTVRRALGFESPESSAQQEGAP